MTDKEIKTILNKWNAAITAPAGHGKTEMIVDLVQNCSGKQLVLTHTNAGVDALKKRFRKRGINNQKYTIITIAAFCVHWCESYPRTSGIDLSIDPIENSKYYYPMIYNAILELLNKSWVQKILMETYTGVIIDEYQDCTRTQHKITLKLNEFLPVRIFGDPLQSIFEWAGPVVDWKNLNFEDVAVRTKPWRWINTNPQLGEFLGTMRDLIKPSLEGKDVTINLWSKVNDHYFRYISPNQFEPYKMIKELAEYNSVLYLTKWPNQQMEFCRNVLPGIFQYDEKQECETLYRWAKILEHDEGTKRTLDVLAFMAECSTAVKSELSAYIRHLEAGDTNFSRIRKYSDLGILLKEVSDGSYDSIGDILTWLQRHKNNPFKIYRIELLNEMQRTIRYSAEHEVGYYEGALAIRSNPRLQKRYADFKYLASRTLLSKGLEFDCVIIDMRKDILSARNFYVAMTRAKKMIYVIAPQRITLMCEE